MIKTICDRCGVEIKRTDLGVSITKEPKPYVTPGNFKENYDLCGECAKDFDKFIMERKDI